MKRFKIYAENTTLGALCLSPVLAVDAEHINSSECPEVPHLLYNNGTSGVANDDDIVAIIPNRYVIVVEELKS